MTYDPENIFAKILSGDIPSIKLYEDDATFVFMDIMPRSEGHALVIPKTPARNMLDASPKQLVACMATVQKISRAMMKGLGADGVTLQQFNEDAGGQEVYHLHFHVLPRYSGARMRPPGTMGDMAAISATAEKIKAAIA